MNRTMPPGRTAAAQVVAAAVASVVIAGCAAPPVHDAPPGGSASTSLAGTQWRLVELRSMDDRQGIARPDERSKYTMQLNPDGSVTMQLNCNRATGTWRADASADPTNGGFRFGPLATARALCPPPSLDERVAAQAQQVRGYLLRSGRLNLSLMADGGIQVWEPADIEIAFSDSPDRALEAAILDAAPGYSRQAVGAPGQAGRARYVHSRVDLDGDGRPETLVFLMGSYFCGTGGCNLMLFMERGGRYVLVNDFPISRPPVIVSPRRTHGWNDLVRLESGGGGRATYLRHTFDGRRYVPAERTPVEEVPPEGRWALAGELGPTVGAPLAPRP